MALASAVSQALPSVEAARRAVVGEEAEVHQDQHLAVAASDPDFSSVILPVRSVLPASSGASPDLEFRASIDILAAPVHLAVAASVLALHSVSDFDYGSVKMSLFFYSIFTQAFWRCCPIWAVFSQFVVPLRWR